MNRCVAIVLMLLPAAIFAEGQQPLLDKWWPMCVLDGSGGGAVNTHIKEMVRMAAQCGVHLDIYPASIPPGADGGNPKAFIKAAKEKCNLTYGLRALGANRGSILAILGNEGTARSMCSAQGAIDRKSCGELSFDPGESIKYKMANAGYFGGVAKPGEAAVSIVAGSSINARDMSAVALGQGMMALPQGFGSGNGVGSELEGQAAGGRGVDSGWTRYGCEKMREAAFVNPRQNMFYRPDINAWLPTGGKIYYLDVYDSSRPLFGKPGGASSSGSMMNAGAPQTAGGVASAQKVGGGTSREMVPQSESVFRSSTTSSRASQSSTAPGGHPNRTQGQVTSLRQSADDVVRVESSNPSSTPERKGNKLSTNDDAKIDEAYLKELGAGASANTYAGGESSLEKISALAEAAAKDTAQGSSPQVTGGASAAVSAGGGNAGGSSSATPSTTSGSGNMSSGSAITSTNSAGTPASSNAATGDALSKGAAGSSSPFNSPADFWGRNRAPASNSDRNDEQSSENNSGNKEEESPSRRRRNVDYYGGAAESGSRSGGSDANVTRIRQ